MKIITVIVPGIGYTKDKPLLYFAKKLALEKGHQVITLNFDGFPDKVFGSKKKITEAQKIAFEQICACLYDIDWNSYDRINFISKSIGTAAAVLYDTKIISSQTDTAVNHILYTPLEITFSSIKKIKNPHRKFTAFSGTKDPWINNETFIKLAEDADIPYFTFEDANHSLETGNTFADLKNLQTVIKETKKIL